MAVRRLDRRAGAGSQEPAPVGASAPAERELPAVFDAAVGHQRDTRRTPDPAWVAALAELAPRSERHTWLYLAWEPGDPWGVVARWVIWQMLPRPLVDARFVVDLEGPDPRSTGHYCAPGQGCGCRAHTRTWRGGASALVDRAQWRMYRGLDDPATAGHLATRWWIVQGAHGGHQRRFDPLEARLLRLQGLPHEPALPGDLPYAEPNALTWAAVRARDAMARSRVMADFLDRKPEWFEADERAALERARAQLLAWLGDQVRDTLESGGAGMQKVLAEHRNPTADAHHIDYDAEKARFIAGETLDVGEGGIDASRPLTIAVRK